VRVAAAALVLALGLAGAAQADVAYVSRLKALSDRTPFVDGCGVPGDETPNSEAEPYIAVNPRDPNNVVATWQQDRFAIDGGALSNLVATSKDGGRTWKRSTLPGLSRCTDGTDERTSDPWVSIGGDGTVYQASLTFSETPAALFGLAGPTALASVQSADGGITWSQPTPIVNAGLYDDREALTADPKRPGHAYVAWVRRLGALGESGVEYFVRTTDGGKSWSSPAPIYTSPPSALPDPTLITVLPDGSLLNTFVEANGTPILFPDREGPINPWGVHAMRSTDLGDTWSPPVKIATINDPFAPRHPETKAVVRAYPMISTEVAPDGSVFIAWNEISAFDKSRVYVARSDDKGLTWTAPVAVTSKPTQAFIPALAISGDGAVGVTWDDFRSDRRGDDELTTEVWFALSRDQGASWQETKVAGPFDMLTAPPTGSTGIVGRFVGDYQGLVALQGGFGAIFAMSKPAATVGPSDVFFARIQLGEAPLRLSVRPRRVLARVRRRFRFRVSAVQQGRRQPVAGALVRLAGRRVRTGPSGTARIRTRFGRRGKRVARASRDGFHPASTRIRVLRPKRR
jgi:hypothetical protein